MLSFSFISVSSSEVRLPSVSASPPFVLVSDSEDDDDVESDVLLSFVDVDVVEVDSAIEGEVETEESVLAVLASARAFLALLRSFLSAFYKICVSRHQPI